MAEHTIPVDLYNPGQVFACVGFLEAADKLLGDAEGGFDWSDATAARFKLCTAGQDNPVETVLAFLAEAEIKRFGPVGYSDPSPKKLRKDEEQEDVDVDGDDEAVSETATTRLAIELTETFYAGKGDRMALPIRRNRTAAYPRQNRRPGRDSRSPDR